jgi:hypothetical protein
MDNNLLMIFHQMNNIIKKVNTEITIIKELDNKLLMEEEVGLESIKLLNYKIKILKIYIKNIFIPITKIKIKDKMNSNKMNRNIKIITIKPII